MASASLVYAVNLRCSSVEDILKEFQLGKQQSYDVFLKTLTDKATKSSMLLKYLQDLRTCVFMLDKTHERIVGMLLRIDWLERESDVILEYQALLLDILSAHPVYLPRILRKLISRLVPNKEDCIDKEVIEDVMRKKHEAQFQWVHKLLKDIARFLPLTETSLMEQKLLAQSYPIITSKMTNAYATYMQAAFIRNLLQLIGYLPHLRPTVLDLITSKLLNLDVAAARSDILDAEPEEEEDCEEVSVFLMDNTESKSEKAGTESMVHPKADCLDYLMTIMFSYIHDTCYAEGELLFEEAKSLYFDFLTVFKRLILRTHNSCHVQFLLFYICSFKYQGQLRFCTHFLDELRNCIQRPDSEMQTRRAAAAYMGSFLARSGFVPISTAKVCLEVMSSWVHLYIKQQSGERPVADLEHCGQFHSVCQAIFYVISFRAHEFDFTSERDKQWAKSIGIQELATSWLNPLQFISPLIVRGLASLTRQHEIAQLDTIIKRNQRCFLAVDENKDHLISFFPFDPYLLKRSGHYIKPLQREFKGNLQIESDSESEMEYEDFLPDTSETMSSVWAVSPSKSPDLLHYGTSPGFQHA